MIDYLLEFAKLFFINVILSSSLNMINGYCGLFSLGHAGFFAVGAYAGAAASLFLFPGLAVSHPLLCIFLACLVGMAAAGVAGLAVGIPCLRLSGDYLAIATIGFGEIIRIVILNMDSVGAQSGLAGIPNLSSLGVIATAAAATVWILYSIVRSAFGRAIISVREDEIAARSMGINISFYKNFAFVVGSMFAGLGGVLFAHLREFIAPANFQFAITVQILVMIVLGGLGSMRGAILGALIVTAVPELLRFSEYTSQISNLVFGVIMIVVMLWKPEGLMGLFLRKRKKVAL